MISRPKAGQFREWRVVLHGQGSTFAGRLCAVRKSDCAIQQAHRGTLEFAKYVRGAWLDATLETSRSPPELIPRFRCGKVESYLSRVYVSPQVRASYCHLTRTQVPSVCEKSHGHPWRSMKEVSDLRSPEIGKFLDGSRIAMFLPCKYNFRLLRML